MPDNRTIAYFSMEIGLEPGIPTYSGGLGILAGDTIRAAADLSVPMVAVTLLHRKGYFYQRVDTEGRQTEEGVDWVVDDFLEELPTRCNISIEGRTVELRAWRYEVQGATGYTVPVYFLDADLPFNCEADRRLTDSLYGDGQDYRIRQEAILGIGGVRMLQALEMQITRFHMNEGHAAFLTLELLAQRLEKRTVGGVNEDDYNAIRKQCVFTTHTPVPAGHDQFPMDQVTSVLGPRLVADMNHVCCFEGKLNTTFLALSLSHYVNGVAKRHGEVSQHMFSHYAVDAITNGVHAGTWTCAPIAQLFDTYIPGWRADSFSLRNAHAIPSQEIWDAHQQAKQLLIHYVNHETNAGFDVNTLTLGFARRMTAYKRPGLIFTDTERLKRIAAHTGPFQIVMAGLAHPQDHQGKQIIQQIFEAAKTLKGHVRITYVADYDIDIARLMTAGVDVWLNTPQPPMEASGTSGMKAAFNGVPSLSVLDGWWIEGCIEGATGWAIGSDPHDAQPQDSSAAHAESLYDKLENVVIPRFYKDQAGFMNMMRHTIALNGSFFNTHRMVQQYALKAYL
jgi:starch phosphorylase